MKLIRFFSVFLLVLIFMIDADMCQTSSSGSLSKSQINLAEEIDIGALVQAQIDSAKARNLRGEIKSYINYIYTKSVIIPSVHKHADVENGSSFFVQLDTRLFIIIGFSVLAFIIVFIRRIKNKSRYQSFDKPKENTQFITEEYNLKENNPELNLVRSGLVNQSAAELSTNFVSSKAKGLKIGKGEVILAAKIKSYQLAHLSSHK